MPTASTPSLDRYSVYVDESGTPHFDAELASEDGYVVCATIVPFADLVQARTLVQRRKDGSLIKASDPDTTDEMTAAVLEQLFGTTGACAAVVTVARRDAKNQLLADQILAARRHEQSSIPDLIRLMAAKDAILHALCMPTRDQPVAFADLIFDRGTERPSFEEFVREMWRRLARQHSAGMGDVRWESRDSEPPIMLSDRIAGAMRLDSLEGSLPKTRGVLTRARQLGRLHVQEGFKLHLNPTPRPRRREQGLDSTATEG